MKLQKRRADIIEKQKQLENAKLELKKQYFGIDIIIDRVIENVSSWYLFPEFQKTPHVINLWGMTGTGETSLIRRLSELLNLTDSLFSFEMSKTSRYWIQDTLNDLNDNDSSKPLILLFDEFQHLRSIDEKGRSKDNEMAQIVWKIIDSGKFENFSMESLNMNMRRKVLKLERAIRLGVKVKNGEVVHNKEQFINITNMDITNNDNYILDDPSYMKKRPSYEQENEINLKFVLENRKIRFINYELLEHIARLIDRVELGLSDLEKKFGVLNEKESLLLIKKYLNEAVSPKMVDCSKALVFVCGNLDKAYPMSGHLSPDIDADLFYEESLKVDVGDIKACLRDFLRTEQIARLGNIHLIYPALSKQAYRNIIKHQLALFKAEVIETHDLTVSFSEEFVNLIYNEGVYPTQGTRPLFSSIKQLVHNQFSKVIGEIYLKGWIKTNTICWSANENGYNIEYYNRKKRLGNLQVEVDLPLKALRAKQEQDEKVVVSVHEAGHALVYRILENKSPKLIVTNSASNEFKGAVITEKKTTYSRNSTIKKLAVLVAGFCAEKLIFGTEAVTYGASNDLFRAKLIAKSMVKMWGFQKFETSRVYTDSFVPKRETKQDVGNIIDEAFTISADILKKHESTLVKLSDRLIKKNCLHQEELEQLFQDDIPSLTAAESAQKYAEIYSMKFQKKLHNIEI